MKLRFSLVILLLIYILTNPVIILAQSKTASKPVASPLIALWPNGAPGEKGNIGEEKDMSKPTDNKVAGRELIRLGNVSNPTITVYRPSKEKDTGAAMVVCPGGGYHILALDLEGTEVCEWLNSIGVTAILLKYRVPVREGLPRYAPPLQDAQRAMGIVRSRAAEWGISPNRIGIMGFSAGAHLSAALSTNYDKRTYPAVDAADQVSCKPDFTMLIYPAYLTATDKSEKIAPELPITASTSPTLLIQTQDDGIPVENSVYYYLALKNAGVPVEMHLYPKGGHGYGLRKTDITVTSWPQRAEEWLRAQGLLIRK
ncbi:alpha/beta hydrolase [Rhodocytophaga rosea]|uniref:Alpha/beta hydrolase n=1 Tax=Rhodocytophaga rosea TaxID=2704465 RepID=A0A6C0GC68_9BACT|nr:alpha/beta hydrolase [Rhodocytophaga rosea]